MNDCTKYDDKADMLTATEVKLREEQLATYFPLPGFGAANPFEKLAEKLQEEAPF